jgi:hypothetical protein
MANGNIRILDLDETKLVLKEAAEKIEHLQNSLHSMIPPCTYGLLIARVARLENAIYQNLPKVPGDDDTEVSVPVADYHAIRDIANETARISTKRYDADLLERVANSLYSVIDRQGLLKEADKLRSEADEE